MNAEHRTPNAEVPESGVRSPELNHRAHGGTEQRGEHGGSAYPPRRYHGLANSLNGHYWEGSENLERDFPTVRQDQLSVLQKKTALVEIGCGCQAGAEIHQSPLPVFSVPLCSRAKRVVNTSGKEHVVNSWSSRLRRLGG